MVYAMDPDNSVIKRLWCICSGTHEKCLARALVMSTHNMWFFFCGKICVWIPSSSSSTDYFFSEKKNKKEGLAVLLYYTTLFATHH